MGYYFGRFLQIVGLVTLPIGVLLALSVQSSDPWDRAGERIEFLYFFVSLAAFGLGSLVVKVAARKSSP